MTGSTLASAAADREPASEAGADASRDAEVRALHSSARRVSLALAVVAVPAFLEGAALLEGPGDGMRLAAIALLGLAGSSVGALTSLLARYSAGFELADGERVPPAAEGALYHRRIAFCFVMRPVLGVLVAPLIVGGVTLFMSRHEDFENSVNAMMLVSFVGGLYAKSVLEAAKSAFKVVFRA